MNTQNVIPRTEDGEFKFPNQICTGENLVTKPKYFLIFSPSSDTFTIITIFLCSMISTTSIRSVILRTEGGESKFQNQTHVRVVHQKLLRGARVVVSTDLLPPLPPPNFRFSPPLLNLLA